MTLSHGAFEARETVLQCATGCRREDGRKLTLRQPELAELLIPGSRVGYDVMVHVGVARFVHYQQRETIRAELAKAHGLNLSAGEISQLAKRFLVYLQALHTHRAPELCERLRQDGGWPLHVDATGEAGRGTLLVVWAGWRHWVLGSWKIPSENAEIILARLRTVRDLFGTPCGMMRDLGKAMIRACLAFVEGLAAPIPIWGCHFHLVRDVGKDLLAGSYDQLRTLVRENGLRAHLRSMARDLTRALGSDLAAARKDVEAWMDPSSDHRVPAGRSGVAVGRALAEWVLDYPADGADEGFPFDLPYLDLFGRCQQACRAVEAFLHAVPADAQGRRTLERLHRIVVVTRHPAFASPVRILEHRRALLAELRGALSIEAKLQHAASPPQAPRPASPEELEQERTVREALDQFVVSLRERRPERGPGEDAREAIDLVLDHLKRHRNTLSDHAITLPSHLGGGVRLADRTNIALENFFGLEKRGERKRSGRKNLAADLESLPAAAPLALNLNRPDYVAILCGDLEKLAKAFAELDAANRAKSLPARYASITGADGGETEDARTSLPKADRKLIRSPDFAARIRNAARGRAPRLVPAQMLAASA
jgi:hypothetical protein